MSAGEDPKEMQRIAQEAHDKSVAGGQVEAPPTESILQYFVFAHLPPHLQAISEPFSRMADNIVATLPRNAERTVALRKLLESKDAAVRAALAK